MRVAHTRSEQPCCFVQNRASVTTVNNVPVEPRPGPCPPACYEKDPIGIVQAAKPDAAVLQMVDININAEICQSKREATVGQRGIAGKVRIILSASREPSSD